MLADSVAVDSGFLKRPAGKDFAFFGPAFTDDNYFGTGAGIAMRKGDAGLKAKFDQAIKDIRANGTYQKIKAKYFDFDVYGAR